MGTWYAKEWYFPAAPNQGGIRSSVGIIPLYNNRSLLSLRRFFRDSHFKFSKMPVCHTPSFIIVVSCYKSSGSILNFFELVLSGPKQNRCIPGLGAPILCMLPLLPLEDKAYRFRLRKPRVRLALVQILLICVFHLKSFVILKSLISESVSVEIALMYKENNKGPRAVQPLRMKGPLVRSGSGHILSLRFGHEKKSTTILTLPLIQEGQLSITGERMGT